MCHFLAKKGDLSFLIEKSNYMWDYFFQLSMGVLGGGVVIAKRVLTPRTEKVYF